MNCCMGVVMRGLVLRGLDRAYYSIQSPWGHYSRILLMCISFLFLAYLRLDQIRSLAPLLVAIILCCLNLFCATMSYWSDEGKRKYPLIELAPFLGASNLFCR